VRFIIPASPGRMTRYLPIILQRSQSLTRRCLRSPPSRSYATTPAAISARSTFTVLLTTAHLLLTSARAHTYDCHQEKKGIKKKSSRTPNTCTPCLLGMAPRARPSGRGRHPCPVTVSRTPGRRRALCSFAALPVLWVVGGAGAGVPSILRMYSRAPRYRYLLLNPSTNVTRPVKVPSD
jgi:hypothetical protein